jgi:hypothetical protein
VDGKLERAGDRWRLRFERELAHDPDVVWRALTEMRWGDDPSAGTSVLAWGDVHPGYVAAFGPEASTIGPPPGHDAARD